MDSTLFVYATAASENLIDNRHPCRLSLCGWTPPILVWIGAATRRATTDLGSWNYHYDGLRSSAGWLHAGYQRMGAVPGR